MARESETYRDRLVYNREKLQKLFPGVEELAPRHVAALTGICLSSVHNHKIKYGFVDGFTTVEKVSRAQSKEP